MNKRVPEQPSPCRKPSKRESCYGDRVYVTYELSLRRGLANILCIVPILTDDPRREFNMLCMCYECYYKDEHYHSWMSYACCVWCVYCDCVIMLWVYYKYEFDYVWYSIYMLFVLYDVLLSPCKDDPCWDSSTQNIQVNPSGYENSNPQT